MFEEQDLRATGDRIERLLDQLQAGSDPRSCAIAEELLRIVSDLYGAGLERIVETARALSPGLLTALVEDELVASLLIAQGLHPESLAARVEKALAQVRPLLATHAGDVELIDLDVGASAVRLRLLGSCDGCPSSGITLQTAVERVVQEAAPEIVRIEVDEPSRPTSSVPISLRTKPTFDACPSEAVRG